MATKTTTAPLSPEVADRLLDLLSTDDDYRARFQRDPRAALMEVGHEPSPPAKMTACGALPIPEFEALIDCRVENLAPKDVIANARKEIKAMLMRGLSQEAPKLDATLTSSRFTRK